MKLLRTTVICIFAFIFANLSYSQTYREFISLIDIHRTTKGYEWNTQWDLDAPIETWQGVTIKNGHVVALDLSKNNLKGKLPMTIVNLKHLVRLDLSGNTIGGDLPGSMRRFKDLTHIDLSDNQFEGIIKKGFLDLERVQSISFANNNFEGDLPAGIGSFKDLKTLNLANNTFEGELPIEITNLNKLETLTLSNNKFDGKIPEKFSNLKALKNLELANNDFEDYSSLIPFYQDQLINFDLKQEMNAKGIEGIKGQKEKMADTKFDINNEE